MNPSQAQSGWQGLGPQAGNADNPGLTQPGQMGYGSSAMNSTVQQILSGQNPYAVDPSPTAPITGGGSPNIGALGGIASLVALA